MLQQSFYQAKAYIAALQAAAVELKHRHAVTDQEGQQLAQVLRSLQQLHRLVSSLLAHIQLPHQVVEDLVCGEPNRDTTDEAGAVKDVVAQGVYALMSTPCCCVQ